MCLNINYVGIGKMFTSLRNETHYILKRHRFEKKKYFAIGEMMKLYGAKMFIKNVDLWEEIKSTEKEMKHLEITYNECVKNFVDVSVNMQKNLDEIEENVKDNKELSEYIHKKLG